MYPYNKRQVLTGENHLVGLDDVTDTSQVRVGENEAHVAFDVGKQLLQTRVLVQLTTDGFPDGRVFPHQNYWKLTQSDLSYRAITAIVVVYLLCREVLL